jgi:NADPH:quinone reductase-like Zn-dependent oxidoreductase
MPIGHAHYDAKRNPILGDIPRFAPLVLKALRDREKRKRFKLPTKSETMEIFRSLLETGKVTPVVGRTFGLDEVVAAMQCMQEGTVVGRLAIVP